MKKKFVKIFTFFIFTSLFFLVFPQQILASVDFPTPTSVKVYNPVLPKDLSDTSGTAFLQKILQLGVSLALVIGAIIFFFMLLVGGIGWISGGGDKSRLESAQKQITHSLIGLAILLSVFAIIKLVGSLFGIDLLKITLPTL